jgi:hypothetical protein
MKTHLIKLSSLSLFAMLVVASGFVASSASAANLIGEWNFDSSSRVNTGSSGSDHDGTAVNTLTYEAANFSAGFDSGMALDVTNGYMRIDNSAFGDGSYADTFDQTSFSVSLWMKADPLTDHWKSIADKGNPGGGGATNGWDIRKWGSSTSARADINNTSNGEFTSFPDVFDNEWHHIVMTVDSENNLVSSYLDAGTPDTGAVTLTNDISDALNFGQYIGLIDEIKYYDGVLSAEEVRNLSYYNTTNSPSRATGLIGEWNFDSSSLANAGSSGFVHDGTAVGTLTYTNSTLFGGSGKALDASVASSYMSIDNTDSDFGGYFDTFDQTTFSISLWMKAPVGGVWQQAARKGHDASWQISQNSAGPAGRVIVGGVNDSKLGTAFNDEWHHVVLTVENGTAAKSYWDNIEKTSAGMASITYTPATASALLFGVIVGLVDEIKIYDRVLTSEEVENLYQNNYDNPPRGTVISIK